MTNESIHAVKGSKNGSKNWSLDQSYTWGMGVETWMRIVGKGIYIRQGTQGYIIDIFNF